MRMTLTAAVTLVVVGVSVAGAQTQPPQDRINTALARARQVGIPVALLEAKIAEGKAKGVSLERIAAAIERREATLEHANQVMKPQPGGDAELSVAADAIESGVSDSVLKAVADSSPKDRRAVAIAALTQLVQLGHGSTEALAKVQEALKRGPEALLNLPAESSGRGRGQANEGPQGVANGNPGGAGGNAGGNSGASGVGHSPTTPPPNVPAPGQSTQPTKPSKDAGNQGRGTGAPAGGRGPN